MKRSGCCARCPPRSICSRSALCSALHPATGPLTAWLGVSRLQNEEALLGDLGSVVRGVNADGGVGGEDMGGGGSFTQRMTATIMANLVVQINNVRVVYEDASSITARPFAFGLALDRLSIQTCTADWRTQFVSEDEPHDVMYKLASVEGLSVYFNMDTPPAELRTHIEAGVSRRAFEGWTECILQPLTSEVRVTTHKPGSQPDGRPLTQVHLIMEALDLRLSNDGIISLITVGRLLADKERWSSCMQFRPQLRPGSEGPEPGQSRAATIAAWWRYAFRGVAHNVRKLRPAGTDRAGLWKLASELILARSRYVKLYKRRTKLSGREFAAELAVMKGAVSDEDMQQLQELEDRLPTSNVLFFRAIAHAELAAEKRVSKAALREYKRAKDDAMGGGLRRLGSKLAMSSEEYAARKPAKPEWQAVSLDQREEVYRSLGLVNQLDAGGTDREAVKLCVEVSINGSISLANSPTEVAGARADRAVECALLKFELERCVRPARPCSSRACT